MKSLQKFASVHANLHNHFKRPPIDRQTYRERPATVLAEWQPLMARRLAFPTTAASIGGEAQLV